MTGLVHIHQCPRCVLRFTSTSEMQDHLSNDHRPRERADSSPTVHAPPVAVVTAVTTPAPPQPRTAPSVDHTARGSRLLGWVLTLAGLALIILTAWFTSTPTAVITTVLVLGLAASYAWRARSGALQRR